MRVCGNDDDDDDDKSSRFSQNGGVGGCAVEVGASSVEYVANNLLALGQAQTRAVSGDEPCVYRTCLPSTSMSAT